MRDLLILSIIFGGALYALKRPWIGVLLWTWVSIMNPHKEFAHSAAHQPVALAIAVCTLLGFLATKERQNPLQSSPARWLAVFVLWTCITLPASLYFDKSLPLWERSIKIYFMVFVTLALLMDRRQLQAFVYVVVLSLTFYGIKGGLFTAASGGAFRVWGPPDSFIEGNNEIALALIMTIPLMRYLQLTTPRRWEHWAWHGAMALTALTVLGTHSRGALLGITAMFLFLWWRSERKGLGLIALVALGAIGLNFMPEHWWERMNTIQTYDQDASALGRINAWIMAFNLANDRPFGGGFMIYYAEVFQRYSPEPERVHAAHSIYFQVLGEHGWVGLLLFLGLGASTWLCAGRLIKNGRAQPELAWARHLGAMIQVSMVGYAVGGAFLSLAYFDLPYNMMIMAVLAAQLLARPLPPPALVAALNTTPLAPRA
ncbi:putative O-glycosylation ligase, exosortase A system-associated [Inhella sp.]|uniref:putative O-glycosylation ligase, exosortase A system-associated n=1 Tax=Inhella sp. TaxID=1921806 RepID=UPI0035B002E9